MEPLQSGAVPIVNLPGTGSLLSRAWVIYKRLFKPLFILSVLLGVALLVYLGVIKLINLPVVDASHTARSLMEVLNVIIQGVSYFAYAYFFAAMLFVVKHRNEGVLTVKEALAKAKPMYRSLLWVGLLSALAIYGSAITVLLPLLMTVWFYFAIYIVVGENLKGIHAIAKSRYLTRGVWLAIMGRYLALVGILTAIGFLVVFVLGIPAAGGVLFVVLMALLALLAIPFYSVYDYLRYEDLVALPRSTEFQFFRGERNVIMFFTIVGLIFMSGGWTWTLLTCDTRTNVKQATFGVVGAVLSPIVANMGPNLESVATAMNRMVYVYEPEICAVPLSAGLYDTYPTGQELLNSNTFPADTMTNPYYDPNALMDDSFLPSGYDTTVNP